MNNNFESSRAENKLFHSQGDFGRLMVMMNHLLKKDVVTKILDVEIDANSPEKKQLEQLNKELNAITLDYRQYGDRDFETEPELQFKLPDLDIFKKAFEAGKNPSEDQTRFQAFASSVANELDKAKWIKI